MKEYLELVKFVLENGEKKEDRTGTGTLSVFGYQNRYDLREGFPLVTTKKVYFRGILHELLWFLKGDTNIKYLVDNNVKIWNEWPYETYKASDAYLSETLEEFVEKVKGSDEFAAKWGELGPIYGKQWIRWPGSNGQTINQIQNVLDQIKKNPNSRRHIVSGWNVADIQDLIRAQKSAPPLCHTMFQFNVTNGEIDMQLYQRSADIALGVPFNIASYSMLLMMVAKECDLTPRYFIHTFGDAHIYLNHVEGLKEQLTRTPHKRPTLKIADKPFWDLRFEDFELTDYICNEAIKFTIAV
ncbi:thymidylate synthase [Patescibacteria group bacterium]|nr:thymidylate synthase [Patescibacteria group bacterium]MBU1015524.1 thymidylate synthase [Patescibacteria group bacterium]MBU1685642.1 thymidylate synthase [Patescibacteria group bacterium]MBU1938135.1 thymidylate synthase [Patescibacteria group bacterium]